MQLNTETKQLLHEGIVIPAHPLALTPSRTLDERSQRLLTKYYIASGARGVALGVHTTQFNIRNPAVNLYEKVLSLAADEVSKSNESQIIKVAGVSGPVKQALQETKIAKALGYDLVLLNVNGLESFSEENLLDRAREIGTHMPLFGFYMQPAVGGKVLSEGFWKSFCEIPSVYAIKIAPFDRYKTLEVVKAVCNSRRFSEIALYTGNDDNILNDLLTTYRIKTPEGLVEKDIVGGLLGHWAVWTHKAVLLLNQVKKVKTDNNQMITKELLTKNIQITDCNSAFFDSKNGFKGCIAGIHEVLRRQGLMKGIWCLDPEESLSKGQSEEIDRVYVDYPDLNDDVFVKSHIKEWQREISLF